jgi:hypothetical protein
MGASVVALLSRFAHALISFFPRNGPYRANNVELTAVAVRAGILSNTLVPTRPSCIAIVRLASVAESKDEKKIGPGGGPSRVCR